MLAHASGGMQGTTSAHAENTYDWLYGVVFAWNYLRARGEYKNTG